MTLKTKLSSLAVLSAVMMGSTAYADKAHWTYSGEEGPAHWGTLSPAYKACSTGRNQSPINLTGFVESELKPLEIAYKAGGNKVINNSHSVMVAYQSGSVLKVDGIDFELKQFHFHAPSENTINGKSYPMEVHLVHMDKDKNLAVVAVMFEEGAANPMLEKIFSVMPKKPGGKDLAEAVTVEAILPKERGYYRFNGSLTTPPCSEGVRWMVMKKPVTASKEQIEKFSHVMHHPNNRPVQPLNARAVMQ